MSNKENNQISLQRLSNRPDLVNIKNKEQIFPEVSSNNIKNQNLQQLHKESFLKGACSSEKFSLVMKGQAKQNNPEIDIDNADFIEGPLGGCASLQEKQSKSIKPLISGKSILIQQHQPPNSLGLAGNFRTKSKKFTILGQSEESTRQSLYKKQSDRNKLVINPSIPNQALQNTRVRIAGQSVNQSRGMVLNGIKNKQSSDQQVKEVVLAKSQNARQFKSLTTNEGTNQVCENKNVQDSSRLKGSDEGKMKGAIKEQGSNQTQQHSTASSNNQNNPCSNSQGFGSWQGGLACQKLIQQPIVSPVDNSSLRVFHKQKQSIIGNNLQNTTVPLQNLISETSKSIRGSTIRNFQNKTDTNSRTTYQTQSDQQKVDQSQLKSEPQKEPRKQPVHASAVNSGNKNSINLLSRSRSDQSVKNMSSGSSGKLGRRSKAERSLNRSSGKDFNQQVFIPKSRAEKLSEFKVRVKNLKESGEIFQKEVMDIHETLIQKEFKQSYSNGFSESINVSPLQGHEVSKDYRTKMVDWMIEVCTSFKCSVRTYFLAVQIFDNILQRMSIPRGKTATAKVLQNKDIHSMGLTSMYIASKYEDIYPLHSRIIADKIAHGAISSQEILKMEGDFLKIFDFQVDFVTHFDFHKSFILRIRRFFEQEGFQQINSSKKIYEDGDNEKNYWLQQTKNLEAMALLLTKMSLQNVQFSSHSPSVIVLSAFYAASAFLKLSEQQPNQLLIKYCTQVRKAIFQFMEEDRRKFLQTNIKDLDFEMQQKKVNQNLRQFSLQSQIQSYIGQVSNEQIEKVAMDLIDFFKIFDKWHCGLNQLKKFNKIPIDIPEGVTLTNFL